MSNSKVPSYHCHRMPQGIYDNTPGSHCDVGHQWNRTCCSGADSSSSDSLSKVFGLGWSVLPISPTFEITNLYHQHFQSYIIHMIGWMLHILLVLRCSRNASASELWNQRGCLTIGMLKDFGTSTSPTTLVLFRLG